MAHFLHQLFKAGWIEQFNLVEHHYAGPLVEAMAVGRELPLDHVQVGDHILSAGIDQVDQQPGALDVA